MSSENSNFINIDEDNSKSHSKVKSKDKSKGKKKKKVIPNKFTFDNLKDKSVEDLLVIYKENNIKTNAKTQPRLLWRLIKLLNTTEYNKLKKFVRVKEKVKPKPKEKYGEYKSLPPLVKWSGGKKDEIKMFYTHIPPDIDTYLEPFIGGGSLFFHINHSKNVINDVHTELIAFYKSIKNGKIMDIYNFMKQKWDSKNVDNNEAEYYKIRDEMDFTDELENAKRFYYLRKMCYRGMLRYNRNGKFNIPYGRYKTCNFELLKEKKKDYEELFKNTEVLNQDFETIFQNYNDSKNFMFLDPPYDSEFTDYGYCSFGKEEHKKLAKCFKETNIRCLMIIGKTDFIKDLYKDYIKGEYEKNYRFKLHSNRIGNEINTKHLIIKNY